MHKQTKVSHRNRVLGTRAPATKFFYFGPAGTKEVEDSSYLTKLRRLRRTAAQSKKRSDSLGNYQIRKVDEKFGKGFKFRVFLEIPPHKIFFARVCPSAKDRITAIEQTRLDLAAMCSGKTKVTPVSGRETLPCSIYFSDETDLFIFMMHYGSHKVFKMFEYVTP